MSGSTIRSGVLGLAVLTLSGCVLFDGGRHNGPDEFGVVSRAPLSQPPDYALRPPRSGAERPNEVTPRDQARNDLMQVSARDSDSRYAMAGGGGAASAVNGASSVNGVSGVNGTVPADGLSPGEHALLREADALGVDPDIRVTIDRESGRVTEDKSLVDKLVFWDNKENPTGTVIDPKREAERLKRNAALGVPPTESAAKDQ